MQAFAAGLQSLGLRAGGRVSLFSENSSRWLIADQGIMMNGAADAVSETNPIGLIKHCRMRRPWPAAVVNLTRLAARCAQLEHRHGGSAGECSCGRHQVSWSSPALCIPSLHWGILQHMRHCHVQVRGSTTPVEEQAYILRHSRSSGLIIQDGPSLERLLPHIRGGSNSSSSNGNGSSENGSGSNGNGASSSRATPVRTEHRAHAWAFAHAAPVLLRRS